jgi:hypothetical protein
MKSRRKKRKATYAPRRINLQKNPRCDAATQRRGVVCGEYYVDGKSMAKPWLAMILLPTSIFLRYQLPMAGLLFQASLVDSSLTFVAAVVHRGTCRSLSFPAGLKYPPPRDGRGNLPNTQPGNGRYRQPEEALGGIKRTNGRCALQSVSPILAPGWFAARRGGSGTFLALFKPACPYEQARGRPPGR